MTLLQQALEALTDGRDWAEDALKDYNEKYDDHPACEGGRKIIADSLERINAAITALRAAIEAGMVVQQGWRPISEAPKDGTFVLLTGGETSEDDYRKEGVEKSRPVTAKWLDDKYCESDSGWVYDYWDGLWRSCYENPTHFMELPPAPTQEDGK